METGKEEKQYYKTEEYSVVGLANTVIEPPAMVVKVMDTSVALATVLGSVLHMRVTHFTVEVVLTVIKYLPKP